MPSRSLYVALSLSSPGCCSTCFVLVCVHLKKKIPVYFLIFFLTTEYHKNRVNKQYFSLFEICLTCKCVCINRYAACVSLCMRRAKPFITFPAPFLTDLLFLKFTVKVDTKFMQIYTLKCNACSSSQLRMVKSFLKLLSTLTSK